MADQLFFTSSHGKLLNSAAGVTKPLKVATFGTSLMTAGNGFGLALAHALYRYHNANVTFNHRAALTSAGDPTPPADPGQCYATGSATSSHMVGAQLTQFNTDVAAGKTADIVFTDGGLYNDNPGSQSMLDTAFARTMTVISAVFDPAGNDGLAVAVVGTNLNSSAMCTQWANMWRRQEAISGGRIRFVDAAPLLADRTHTNPGTWAWRLGGNVQGSMSTDGTHPDYNGSRAYAPLIADFLRAVCPATYPYGGNGIVNPAYSAANGRYGNLFGAAAAMLGTDGYLDYAPNANVPGVAASGYNNRWSLASGGGSGLVPTITTGPQGGRELNINLDTFTGSGYFSLSIPLEITNVNNSIATRKYMQGATVELVGVSGLCLLENRQQNTGYWDLPISPSGSTARRLPNNTSETWNFRTLFPVPYSGNSPYLSWLFHVSGALAGNIKIRDPWWYLVEE